MNHEFLRTYLDQFPRVLFAAVSGAHAYGFESPDSDIDLRGVFSHPTDAVLGLHRPNDTRNRMEWVDIDGVNTEMDLVLHEVVKFVRLLLRGDGNALELVYGPVVVATSSAHEELKALARPCIRKCIHRHYRGFAWSQWERSQQAGTVKSLLYTYRTLATGIWALQTGHVVPDLRQLAPELDLVGVDDLIAQKRAGDEKAALPTSDLTHHRAAIGRLFERIDAAHLACSLPDTVDDAALDAFVIRMRRQ